MESQIAPLASSRRMTITFGAQIVVVSICALVPRASNWHHFTRIAADAVMHNTFEVFVFLLVLLSLLLLLLLLLLLWRR